jgi:hypothetical protein
MKVNNKKEREIWKNPDVNSLVAMGAVQNPLILGLEESGLQSISEEGVVEYADESSIIY